jgi:hypothetical protein
MKKFIIVFTIFACASSTWGWENTITHRDLTGYIADHYFDSDLLKEDLAQGLETGSARDWLRRGSIHEDDGTKLQFLNGTARSINHFHVPTITNPTKATLETAGLSDWASGMLAILWAQTGAYQNEMGWEDWSWDKVREHEYNYLTSLSKTDEDANLARMLKGLGYQMHLIQDMSQPAYSPNKDKEVQS